MSPCPETMSPKLKMHAPLCNQRVNLETDAKTLYYSLLKLKYSLSIYLKHKRESGLSSRAWGRGFSPATKRVAPGYFYWKIEEK